MYAHSEFPPFHRVFCTSSDSPNKQPEYPAYDHIACSYPDHTYILRFYRPDNIYHHFYFYEKYTLYQFQCCVSNLSDWYSPIEPYALVCWHHFKILVLQKIRNIQRILIIRIRFTVIGGMAKTIRESKKFSFLFKRMLIIHVAPTSPKPDSLFPKEP